MAMVVKNNMSAVNTLNQLNENSNALSKSLKKVSSGMRINGAGDDASGYSISEKMRVQLRGLEQDIRNTQNGTALLKVAEGAVSSTVDILRTLKEKALDSANDHNTDEDRAIMQKEVNQYVQQVDDNALVQYNGKYLLDGQTGIQNETVQDMIVSALSTEWLENALDLIEQSYGVSFRNEWAECTDITVKFSDSATLGTSTLAAVGYLPVSGGKTNHMELLINMDQFNSLDIHDTSNVNGKNAAGTGVLDRTIAHEMVHGIMAASITDFDNLSGTIAEGMAELVHGIDDLRTGSLTRAVVTGADFNERGTGATSPTGTNYYSAGYMALRYMAKQGGEDAMKNFMNVLVHHGASALDGAVSAATGGKFSSWNDMTTQLKADAAAAASDNDFLLNCCGIDLTNDDTGAITGSDASGRRMAKTKDSVVPEGGSTTFWYAPESKTSIIDGLTVHWESNYGGKVGDLTLQVGTKANQSIKFGFHDMRAKAMGLEAADGTKVSIATREQANDAIRLFDQSLRKALNEQTTIGALQSRLEYTASNLTTAAENVQNSESTIRDADMAKEMTEYTKNNVLLQSAQSMLSQANQNSSAVLSLLQ